MHGPNRIGFQSRVAERCSMIRISRVRELAIRQSLSIVQSACYWFHYQNMDYNFISAMQFQVQRSYFVVG